MNSSTKQLYLFLVACSGNWRNSIYIKCQEEKDAPGYLLAADRDGQPVILSVQQFLPADRDVDRPRRVLRPAHGGCFQIAVLPIPALDYAVVGGGPTRCPLPKHIYSILSSLLHPPWRSLRGGFLLFTEN